MLRNNAAFLLYLQLQYTENPSFTCFSLFFINSGVKVSYELKQIPTLVPHVDWILASVLCHLNITVEVLLLWELHSLHKAHTHTHTMASWAEILPHPSHPETPSLGHEWLQFKLLRSNWISPKKYINDTQKFQFINFQGNNKLGFPFVMTFSALYLKKYKKYQRDTEIWMLGLGDEGKRANKSLRQYDEEIFPGSATFQLQLHLHDAQKKKIKKNTFFLL